MSVSSTITARKDSEAFETALTAQSADRSDHDVAPVPVVHVISGLDTGGAETFLLRLLGSLQHRRVVPRVISLRSGGAMVHKFHAAGVDLVELGLTGASQLWRMPAALRLLRDAVKHWRPRLIQGWMNHGNLGAWLARSIAAPDARLIWGIRQTVHQTDLSDPGIHITMRLQAWLSRRPDAIICNSHVGLAHHAAMGFSKERMLVIPNGFDIDRLCPRPARRAAARQQLGFDADAFVVAKVARFHPVKDYETFLAAVALAAQAIPNLRAACIGRGVTASQSGLPARVAALKIGHVCTLLEERADLEDIYPGLDVVCLTSVAEAFPNVLGEAMACGIPCVATDVGDVTTVVGKTGRVVGRGKAAEVAAAIVELYQMGSSRRDELGREARAHIVDQYSMSVIAERYLHLYRTLLSGSMLGNSI